MRAGGELGDNVSLLKMKKEKKEKRGRRRTVSLHKAWRWVRIQYLTVFFVFSYFRWRCWWGPRLWLRRITKEAGSKGCRGHNVDGDAGR